MAPRGSKEKKFVSEYIEEKEEGFKKQSALPLYCDKKHWWTKEICGGQLYNVYGPNQIAQSRFNEGYKFIYAKCMKCDKTYDLPLP